MKQPACQPVLAQPVLALLTVLCVTPAHAAFIGQFNPNDVPEPSSLPLFAAGAAVAAVLYFKNRNGKK